LHHQRIARVGDLYHPIRLIEEICMLDHLSDGRLEIGVGRGVSGMLSGSGAQREVQNFDCLESTNDISEPNRATLTVQAFDLT
jgi:hypothetical protein